jgi:hypothetical protein
MGADKEYRIRIVTVADSSGAKAVADGMSDAAKAAQKGTDANEEHHKSFIHMESSGRLVHSVLHQITEQSPLMGEALRLAISPQGAALFGVVLALRAFQSANEEAMKEAAERADEATDAFTKNAAASVNLSNQAGEATAALKRQFEELVDQQDSSKTAIQETTTSLNAEKEALESILKAEEALAIATAKTDREREDIRLRFQTAGKGLNLDIQRRLLGARQDALSSAEAREASLAGDSDAARAALFGTSGTERGQQKTNAEAELNASVAGLKKFREELEKTLAGGVVASVFGGHRDETEIRADIQRTEANVKFQTERMAALDRHEAEAKAKLDQAEKREAQNRIEIEELRAEIPRLKAQLDLRSATARSTDEYDQAAVVTGRVRQSQANVAASAGSGDLFGFVSSITDLTTNAAMLASLKDSIRSANAAVIDALRAIDESNKRTRNEAQKYTRTLPGQG